MADIPRIRRNSWFQKLRHIKLPKKYVTKAAILEAGVTYADSLGITLGILTNGSLDQTAPIINSSTWDNATNTLTVNANEGGEYFWLVDSSATPPTKNQLQAGLDTNGNPADAFGSFGVANGTTASSPDVSAVPTGQYYIHSLIEDLATNRSDIDTEGPVTIN